MHDKLIIFKHNQNLKYHQPLSQPFLHHTKITGKFSILFQYEKDRGSQIEQVLDAVFNSGEVQKPFGNQQLK